MSAPDDPRGKQTLRAVLKLREMLASGALAPGERLTELTLAPLVGVSRTPLRQALMRLAHEGLTRALPGGGFEVAVFGSADIGDAILLRGTLEGAAARLSAERWARPSQLAALRACLAALDAVMAREMDFAAYVAGNEAFHAALLTLACSPMLERAMAQVTALPFASPSAFVRAQSESAAGLRVLTIAQDQHRCLVDAIAGREGARAEAIAREHALLARRNLETVLQSDRLPSVPGGSLVRLSPETASHGVA